MSQPVARALTLAVAGCIGIAAVLIPAFNLAVDPYRAFGSPEIPGITGVKPETTTYGRLSKAFSVCRVRPDLVFMGSSRNEFLYNPEYGPVRAISRHPYNLSLAGTNIYEMDLMLRHAYYASGRLKTAILGIDFLMFNAFREAESVKREVVDFDPDELILSGRDNCFRDYLRHAGTLLFSPAALAASVKTLAEQDFIEIYLADGMRHPYYNTLSRGLRQMLTQRPGLFGQANAYVQLMWLPPPERNYCFSTPGKAISTLDVFAQMVAFAREKGIRLIFTINPNYMTMISAIKEAGLWPKYEEWKRRMVEILAEDAHKHGDDGFPLYDFTRMNDITAEYAPANDANYRMTYWYEGSHSSQIVGNMMLDKVLHHPNPADPDYFGVRLRQDNIDVELAKSRQALDLYYGIHPDLVHDIKSMVASFPYTRHLPPCPNEDD
ncbi:MAG TPA: hypothetical protein VGR45_08730 [Stellaceae bacterium]|nr:hypothetical protein [Stellaceae bacterium]